MKIIQVTPYYPPHVGGAEQRARDLSEKLSKKGHLIEVFTSDLGCKKEKLKSKPNLKINYLRSWEFAHTPIIPSLFFHLINVEEDSLVHLHVSQALVPEVAFLVSKFKKLRYIAHVRVNLRKTGKFGFLLPVYKRFFLKKVLKNADKIIVLNKDYKNMFAKEYNLDKKKIAIIPNATEFKQVKRIKTKINSPARLLYVGRFTNEKNIPELIKAVSVLKKDIQLFLVGEGEDREKLENLIKKEKLEGKVKFLGTLDSKKIYNAYVDSDIVVLPSKTECFSSVLLESMATGKPIIASDIPGTRSVIKNNYNGLLVKPTPRNLAKAIEKLIANPQLRKKLARNGLKEIKKYSWDNIVSQTEEVYEEVLNKSD